MDAPGIELTADSGTVDARYDRGVLSVRIPLVVQDRPRRIEVGTSRAGAIDVESHSAPRADEGSRSS